MPSDAGDPLSPDAKRRQIVKILQSRTFERAEQLRNFLQVLAEHTIAGNAGNLKEYSIGADVFGRGKDFNPTVDTIVRVQAGRLRSKLEDYYHEEGQMDPIVIELGKGHYVLVFRLAASIQAAGTDTDLMTEGGASRFTRRIDSPAEMLRPGAAPPLPPLLIGRDLEMTELRKRLGIDCVSTDKARLHVLTAVRGWPGVGKTTIAAALAHDAATWKAFPDGVLWASLGPSPNLLAELAAWGRALGVPDMFGVATPAEASARLSAMLRGKQMLLIVDDVWEAEHLVPFRVGGSRCAMLVTTRVNSVARQIAPTPESIYKLDVLNDQNALELLETLAPLVVARNREEALELVRSLEGLPLAIQVAGHLLEAEFSYGFGVSELIAELHSGAKLLEALAPADRIDLAKETTPTVAALLEKSTQRLDSETRYRFACLGAFAPKPATFDLPALQAVWETADVRSTVRKLIDRGLLEPLLPASRFQMHALLVLHARSLCSP